MNSTQLAIASAVGCKMWLEHAATGASQATKRQLDQSEQETKAATQGMKDHACAEKLQAEIAKAIEAEHLRLGMELHDGLAQELVGIGLQLDTLALSLKGSVVEEIRKVRAMLTTTTHNTRSLAKMFFPIEIERCGLLIALQRLARFAEQSWRVSCVVQADANAPSMATDARAVQLFRIAREAIHNAAKHARPKLIQVHLGGRDGKWFLTVKDDGAGLPPASPHSVGMGQSIMHYRASMIGGTLSVRNQEDGGAIVICTAPASPP
jgi:signal transduction histidine kinase